MKAGAILDSTEMYRYSLWREWNFYAPRVGFVMLNPSRADALVDDPTIRRCVGFARAWGFGGLEVVNLFAYRTASPVELSQAVDPVGVENDAYLAALGNRVEKIVLAWGNWGKLQGRDRIVLPLFAPHNPVYCLGITKAGYPRHPLYLKGDVLLTQWNLDS
ncbi:MAG: DUF1643 domain-containing protein [Leptolyngbyaceae cyanobacterium HOT.MB2.61]|nr:DUF1643 domain-containing protein [Leptolyngbyaceae cyanobacterium HOT.MB2.61]